MEYFTGIDLHKTFLQVTTVDASGNVVKQRRLRNDEELVTAYFAAIEGEHHAVVESCLGWYWLRDLCVRINVHLTMAHALYVKAIAYAKVKTDSVDSATLAQLLRTDLIPAAHMISPERRPLRDLTRRRHRLVNERTRMINARKGLLQGVNKQSPEDLEPVDRTNYESLSAIIAALERQITEIERTVATALAADPEYLLAMTIPGIGACHAAEIVLETDGVDRFGTEKQYFSYSRVVPGAYNSGNRTKTRRSKQGNGYLRRAYGDAAVHAIASNPDVARRFEQLSRRHPECQARTLIAKDLARGIYHVLRNREPYTGLKGRPLSQRKSTEPAILRKLEAARAEAAMS